MSFKITFPTVWANFDPNGHMRHTAYNDLAAEVRVRHFDSLGLSLAEFTKNGIGPVLFSENTNFWKEIRIGENVTVDVTLIGASKNYERYRFHSNVYKENGELAAEIEVYGSWLDLTKRKLAVLPEDIVQVFDKVDKHPSFKEIELKKK